MRDSLPEADEKRLFLILAARCGIKRPGEALWKRYSAWVKGRSPHTSSVLDRALLAVALRGRAGAWIASCYAGRLGRRSHLRRREVALLAVLECDAAAARILDTSSGRGPLAAWSCFLFWGAVEALGFLLSLVIFCPVHICGGRS